MQFYLNIITRLYTYCVLGLLLLAVLGFHSDGPLFLMVLSTKQVEYFQDIVLNRNFNILPITLHSLKLFLACNLLIITPKPIFTDNRCAVSSNDVANMTLMKNMSLTIFRHTISIQSLVCMKLNFLHAPNLTADVDINFVS